MNAFNEKEFINSLTDSEIKEYLRLKAQACNPNTPLQILDTLSKSEFYPIRMYVAMHPNVDETILDRLSDNEPYPVLLAVASNPKCSASILRKLSELTYWTGRVYTYDAIIDNPNCPIDLFEKSNVGVSIEPAMWINLSEELVID